MIEYEDLELGKRYNISFSDCCVAVDFRGVTFYKVEGEEDFEQFDTSIGTLQNCGRQCVIFSWFD